MQAIEKSAHAYDAIKSIHSEIANHETIFAASPSALECGEEGFALNEIIWYFNNEKIVPKPYVKDLIGNLLNYLYLSEGHEIPVVPHWLS